MFLTLWLLIYSINVVLAQRSEFELHLNCKIKVKLDYVNGDANPPNLNCYRECLNNSKDNEGWFQQNIYYHNNELEKVFNKVVEITIDRDGTTQCKLATPRKKEDEQPIHMAPAELEEKSFQLTRIKRKSSITADMALNAELGCTDGYEYNQEFHSCLKLSNHTARWEDARDACVLNGDNLIVIDTEGKKKAIETFLKNQDDTFWIGFNDIDKEGYFVWVDGSPFNYSRFKAPQPDDFQGAEDCGMITKYFWGGKHDDYSWNDDSCSKWHRFICQKKKIIYMNNTKCLNDESIITTVCPEKWVKNPALNMCYHVGEEAKNYKDSVTYCESIGGSISSIHSDHEQQFITEFLKKSNFGNVWIGLNDLREEGKYEWVDGTELSFSRWLPTQPDDYKDQDCILLVQSSNFAWDDNWCHLQVQPLCKREAKPLYIQACPSGCLIVTETAGNINEEQNCATVSSENKFCDSSIFRKIDDYLVSTIIVSIFLGLFSLVIGSYFFFKLYRKHKDYPFSTNGAADMTTLKEPPPLQMVDRSRGINTSIPVVIRKPFVEYSPPSTLHSPIKLQNGSKTDRSTDNYEDNYYEGEEPDKYGSYVNRKVVM